MGISYADRWQGHPCWTVLPHELLGWQLIQGLKVGTSQRPSSVPRTYEQTHPWIDFRLNLARAPYRFWMLLGEARSKCDMIAGVPLPTQDG